MIKILKEETNNITNKQLQELYDEQFIRVSRLVNVTIDNTINKLNKMRDLLSVKMMHEFIGSTYIDDNGVLNINDLEDINDKKDEIKYINKIKLASDDEIVRDIKYDLEDMLDY